MRGVKILNDGHSEDTVCQRAEVSSGCCFGRASSCKLQLGETPGLHRSRVTSLRSRDSLPAQESRFNLAINLLPERISVG